MAVFRSEQRSLATLLVFLDTETLEYHSHRPKKASLYNVHVHVGRWYVREAVQKSELCSRLAAEKGSCCVRRKVSEQSAVVSVMCFSLVCVRPFRRVRRATQQQEE